MNQVEEAYAPAKNTFVVPLKDGSQLRFSNIEAAVDAAAQRHVGVKCEAAGYSYSAEECAHMYSRGIRNDGGDGHFRSAAAGDRAAKEDRLPQAEERARVGPGAGLGR